MNNYDIGYKRCGDYIVMLQITQPHNEYRPTCANVLYAKHRCKKAYVLNITHIHTDESIQSIESTFYEKQKLIYIIGQNIIENEFDNNLNNVCGKGIHYFKLKELAKNYKNFCFLYNSINDEYIDYHDNGQIHAKYNYKNEKINGKYIDYYDNGQIFKKCNYVNGQLNGEYKTYYRGGQISIKCGYVNGKVCGEYISYHDNGKICVQCNYINGKKRGKYVSYLYNGYCNYASNKVESDKDNMLYFI
jgi:antitoxin component YwqK of YwqJK toxin-antitoxin module